jgi:hypothetical protein
MPRIVPIGKLYNEQKGRPTSIRNGVGLLIARWNVSTKNDVGGPFNIGGNGLLGGANSGPLRGGNSGPPRDHNPISYFTRPTWPWIGLT